MAWTVMVSHTVLYIFEFMVILSILHTLILNSTLVLFSLCILGQVDLWSNAASSA